MNKERFNFTALMVAFCFSLMTLLGAPLHQHKLEHWQLDPRCVPFHVFESSINLETDISDLSPLTKISYSISFLESVWIASAPLTASSRAPPVIC